MIMVIYKIHKNKELWDDMIFHNLEPNCYNDNYNWGYIENINNIYNADIHRVDSYNLKGHN